MSNPTAEQVLDEEECLDCDGTGSYPSGQGCLSCGGRGTVPVDSNHCTEVTENG